MQYPKEQLLKVDLTNQKVYDAIVAYWHDLIFHNDIPQLLKDIAFMEQWYPLHSSFAEEFPDRSAAIERLLWEARWITLQAHTKPEQTLPLFHSHLLILFALQDHHEIPRTDTDIAKEYLTERLRERLVGIPRFADRDPFKKELYQALITNEEVFTTQPFFRQVRQAPPTVKAWFSEYVEFMGSDEFIPRRFDLFFEKNENAVRLSDEEQDRLKLIFKVYEQLRLSSWKQEGIEEEVDIEEDDKTGKIIYGKVYLDDPKLKEQYRQNMKTYLDIFAESGIYDNYELYSMMPRPAVQPLTTTKNGGYVKPDAITTGPNIAATTGPDHFSEADENEINQHGLEAQVSPTKIDYTAQVATLITELGVHFPTPEAEKRFTELLISVLRGLRDVMEFSQYLVDEQYPAADIEHIVAKVKAKLKGNVVAASRPLGQATVRTAVPTPIVPTVPGQADTSVANQTPAPNEMVEPAAMSTAPAAKTFLPKLRRSRLVKKPMVDDVRLQPSMVMGPVDELRAMDLLEFRRLSTNPVQAANRIKDKIDLLAEESVTKQAEGIQAFKESPVNKIYLDLGNESIATGQPVVDLIAGLLQRGTPTLTVEEFNAITDLNKQIRY